QMDLQNVSDFLITQIFYVAQYNRRPETRVQSFQRRLDHLLRFVVRSQVERRTARVGQSVLIVLIAIFPFQTHFLLAMPRKPAPVIVRFVYRDTVDPRLQAALRAERSDIAEDLQEYFLNDVVGVR